jgi:hypothetical protein
MLGRTVYQGRVLPRIRRREDAVLLCLILTISGMRLRAQTLEPISTEFADPLARGEGTLKIGYEYAHFSSSVSGQLIPLLNLTMGLGRGLELDFQFPVFREKPADNQPALVGGGKVGVGARYLLFGGETHRYAVSLVGIVEPPTGRKQLVGDGSELRAGIFADRSVGNHIVLHSNIDWGTTVGGLSRRQPVLEYHDAVVWSRNSRVVPVFELVGDTNTATGKTELALQPEVIYRSCKHLELKVGLPLGLTSSSPGIGIRTQLAILWDR